MADTPQNRHNKANVSIQVNNDTVGIVAYSDTTAATVSTAADLDDGDKDGDTAFKSDFSKVEDPFTLLAFLAESKAITSVFISFLFIILCIAAILSPFLLIAGLIYYALRNRRQKYKLMEKAIENGQPLPQELQPAEEVNDSYIMRKGIRHAFTGIGLVAMFYCFDMTSLTGIGWLLFFFGAGQAAIAYLSTRKKRKDDIEKGEEVED